MHFVRLFGCSLAVVDDAVSGVALVDHALIEADLSRLGSDGGILAGVADIEAAGLALFVDDGVKRVVAVAVGILFTGGDTDADVELGALGVRRRKGDFNRHDKFGENGTLRAFGEFVFVGIISKLGEIADAVLCAIREGFTVCHHERAHALREVNDGIDVVFAGIRGAEAASGDAGNGG